MGWKTATEFLGGAALVCPTGSGRGEVEALWAGHRGVKQE